MNLSENTLATEGISTLKHGTLQLMEPIELRPFLSEHEYKEIQIVEKLGARYLDYPAGTSIEKIMVGRSKNIVQKFSIMSGEIWLGVTAITELYADGGAKIGRTMVVEEARGLGIAVHSKRLLRQYMNGARLRADIHELNYSSKRSVKNAGFTQTGCYPWTMASKCEDSEMSDDVVIYEIWELPAEL